MKTILHHLQQQLTRNPDRKGHVFLGQKVEEEQSLTYGDLDRKARAIAEALTRERISRPVLLLLDMGPEVISAMFGCLYAGIPAVPLWAVKPGREDARVLAIANDVQPGAVLTSSAVFAKAERNQLRQAIASDAPWFVAEQLAEQGSPEWEGKEASPGQLAYLQYTSGSTSRPRGVMVGHGNVMHNLQYIDHDFHHTQESIALTWLPHFHDMGLIYGIFLPLYTGHLSALMRPASFMQSPRIWLEAITKFKATHSGRSEFRLRTMRQQDSSGVPRGAGSQFMACCFQRR